MVGWLSRELIVPDLTHVGALWGHVNAVQTVSGF